MLTVDGVETSTDDFDAALVCVTDCDSVRVPSTLAPVNCYDDSPEYLENLSGNSGTNPIVDEWYV